MEEGQQIRREDKGNIDKEREKAEKQNRIRKSEKINKTKRRKK
jgi:hypothetical protein